MFHFQESNEANLEAFLMDRGFVRPLAIEPMSGGGNNRVYRVSDGRRQAVLKHYFRHQADMRDRFASERSFYNYLWKRGIRRTPEPLAWDAGERLGLFTFVDGRKLSPGEVDATAVEQALQFIVELNRDQSGATDIPAASEACFTLADHLDLIDKRVARLQQIEPATDIDRQALEFVRDSLQPSWNRIRESLLDRVKPESEIHILSPSDFGFHNALLPADGRFRFLDFEYAGWDDPAKLICDFFCQPQVPVPIEFWDRVTDALGAAFHAGDSLAARARLLLPAYQIKWRCIMLNEFTRHDRERRDFAQGAASAEQRKIIQLTKARSAYRG
jgi:Ser/Thr protein kinase RdoA (MazF antagonist)